MMNPNRKTVLIIEDHRPIRFVLSSVLKKRFEVVTKKDGFEGLAWLSSGNIPDLIVLDMSMPRISGIEFLSNLRSSGFFRNIPVIIVSGEERHEVLSKCEALGIQGVFSKPFNPIELNNQIDQTIIN